MNLTCAVSASRNTLATQQAHGNFASNRQAVAITQPELAIAALPEYVEWVFARDRALTCLDPAGVWLTGCSIPRQAAAEMMQRLDVTGQVACFLAPSHAAQLSVALERLRPEQAIIAIVPDASTMPTLLACAPLAREITAHRLWFVTGAGWPEALARLFRAFPGLCTPSQFIRLPSADDALIESLIGPAQKVFGDINIERSAEIRRLREVHSGRSGTCVVAPSRFRLWDDAGDTLARLFEADAIHVDPDDPIQASSLYVARVAQGCKAIVTANIARGDLPGVISDSVAWITWASGERIPPFRGGGPADRLITAVSEPAHAQGWPADRVIEALWPDCSSIAGAPSNVVQALAMVVDTRLLDAPAELEDFSSHRVLWEMIVAELREDPFLLTADLDAFLSRRMRKLDIAPDTLPVQRFILELILPAYQQGIARLLIRAKLPIKLFGRGWDRLSEFAPFACGAVNTRQELIEIAHQHPALVHAWPNTGPHAIDSLSRPVLRRRGNNAAQFLNDARQILTGRSVLPAFSGVKLSRQVIETAAS